MKVAITGEKGFLGYHLTQYYKNKGWEVISLGRNYLENLQSIEGIEFLIHAAGVNRANSDQEVYDANVELTSTLINTLTQLNLKPNIKFISSIQEINGSMYGNAKLKAKELLQDYCDKTNTTFESYALPNLFGTYGKPNYNSFVNTFAYNIVNNIDCKYNENKIKLCWVYDAIKVIDNQTKEYELFETTVKEVYFLLQGINSGSIDTTMNSLAIKLEQILNYYKNENISIRS
jgi:UDP-2-acetamido-2,6-beta-L-arabino-hexul-4-ose reductase